MGMNSRVSFRNATVVLTVILILTCVESGQCQMKIGIAGTAGAGLFVAQDKDYYAGISADLYPELGLQLHVEMFRGGLKVGYIYRKVEEYSWYYNSYGDWYSEYKYTLSFVPVQAEILLAPMIYEGLSPYAGIMGGMFIAAGDNTENFPAISPKIGLEYKTSPILVYGDLRYTWASKNSVDAGGVMLVVGFGIYLGT